MTFIATANAILHAGATPVFVDVEPDTGNIDARQVERAITSRTRAIIPVHLYGLMADVQDLHDICQRHNLVMIEDAAHATEAVRDGFRPGQLGQAACFSFYATKNLTCGEGGAVATNDSALAERLKRLRSHGMSKEAAGRYTGRYQHWDMLSARVQGQPLGHQCRPARRPASEAGGTARAPGGDRPPLRNRLRGPARASAFPSSGTAPRARDTCLRSGSAPDGATSAWRSCRDTALASRSITARCTCCPTTRQFGFRRGRFPVRRGDRRPDPHVAALSRR